MANAMRESLPICSLRDVRTRFRRLFGFSALSPVANVRVSALASVKRKSGCFNAKLPLCLLTTSYSSVTGLMMMNQQRYPAASYNIAALLD